MTTDARLRALPLFDEYLDLPDAARARLRADLLQRDPDLLAALLALVAADQATSLLDAAPAELLARARSSEPAPSLPDPRIGTRLGAWRIDGIIAQGGMGTVYAAHRDDGQYEQRAALKCVRTTLASPALLQAFRTEREHLARLEHPAIATLLDGGVGEDGQPWFAMRYVDGQPIDAWCDSRERGVRERVDLLIQVCEALSYAHAQGIVHRDIKPSNVLIDAQGRVYLVDFGISSAIGADQASEPIAHTPDYVAPEVLQHGVHAPAADLYALGVLTYHLLCARRPLPSGALLDLVPLASRAPATMDALIAQGPDSIAHHRGVADLARLRRELSSDLSAIALKAVAARPQDRYASVGEFADDLRRWREHRPVAAHPGSRVARAGKWLRRNRIVAGLSAMFVLALGLGIGAVLIEQARIARASRATASVSQLFSATLGTATLSGLGATPFSSRALLQKTERELHNLNLAEQPALHARSLATLARAYATIGDYRHAGALATQARRALGEHPDQEDFVAATDTSLLNQRSRYDEAIELARAHIQALGEREDDIATASRLRFGAELAQAQWGLGQTREALKTLNGLVLLAPRLGPGHEELYAQLLILRADFLFRLARPAPAEADARRAIQVARPVNDILADDALAKLARIVQLDGRPEAMAFAKELLRRRQHTLGASHPKTAQATIRLSVFPGSGLSKQDVANALAAIRAAYGADNPQYATALASAAWAVARDRRETLAQLRAAIAVLDRDLPANSEARLSARYNLALVLLVYTDGPVTPDAENVEGPVARAEAQEALTALRWAIAAERKAGLPMHVDGEFLAKYLVHRGDNAQLPELEALLRELRAEDTALFGADNHRMRELDYFQSKLWFRQGRLQDADRGFARLIDSDRAFIDSLGASGEARYDYDERSDHLLGALAFRGFHALEHCRQADAAGYFERAVKFSAAPGAATHLRRIMQAYLAGAREARLPGIAPQILPELDRERINRAARQCRRGSPTTETGRPAR